MSTGAYESTPGDGPITLHIKEGTTYLSSGLLIADTDKGPLQVRFSKKFDEQTLVTLLLKSGATFFQLNVKIDADKSQKRTVLEGVLKGRKLVLHPDGHAEQQVRKCHCSC